MIGNLTLCIDVPWRYALVMRIYSWNYNISWDNEDYITFYIFYKTRRDEDYKYSYILIKFLFSGNELKKNF